jgi:hypothetical protein
MVERYLDGAMDPAEEREFVERMNADASLRRLVEADRAITSGVRKEMGAMQAGAAEPGAGLLAKLAATPPTAAAVTGGTVGAALLTGGTVKALVVAVGVVGIAVGAFLIAPLMRQETTTISSPARTADSIPAAPAPPAPTDRQTPQASLPADARRPEAAPTHARTGGSTTTVRSATPRGAIEQEKPTAVKPHKATGTELLDEQLEGKPRIFRNDTVRVKVERRGHQR